MKNKILELEKNFFKKEYMSDIYWMNKTISDGFVECGKSGKFFYKKDTIEELSKLSEDRKIDIYNYEFIELSKDVFIVHYITKSNDDKQVYRTSIWVNNNGLKLTFHQASVLSESVDLIKF